MNNNTYTKLELTIIKEEAKSFCMSSLGKSLIDKLEPSGSLSVVKRRLSENLEAKELINNTSHIPLEGLSDVNSIVSDIEKGMIVDATKLVQVQDFLRGSRKIKKFMDANAFYAPTLASYAANITELRDIEDEIDRCIVRSKIDSNSSKELKRIRRSIDVIEGRIKDKLSKILTSSKYKAYIRDFVITKRDDRYVIPIKASHKNDFPGNVLDTSSKGNTVFIEPESIARMSVELISLRGDESVEEYKILCILNSMVYDSIKDIKLNTEIIGEYDMVFAKAKYSVSISGITPKVNKKRYICIRDGKHPLLTGDVVPLNVEIGKGYRGLLITGPNAGGKTVALKTVGILTLMTQCGFDIPAKEGTVIGVFDNIFVDIGDDQSIQNALSTFSSHIKNIAEILRNTKEHTLIMLDEIGSGTEPNEGAALAISILEELYRKKAIILASTHYGELKKYAKEHPDFENAGMLFDKETLNPKYKLIIGKSQNSNALYIANKMGISQKVINKASEYLSGKVYNLDKVEIPLDREVPKVTSKSNWTELGKGDRVWLLEKEDYGLVYEVDDRTGYVTVLFNDEYISVYYNKLKLYLKADKLYPPDYNLDSLFVSYEKRKLERDIKRGSKKAIKKIHKEIKVRKQNNQL